MDRRRFLLTSLAGAVAAPLGAEAQQGTVPRVGWLSLLSGSDAQGLMAYGPDLADLLRRVGTYVDKILKGTKPSDLPVEQPTKLEFVMNIKTAKALGLTIPPSLLARADHIIE